MPVNLDELVSVQHMVRVVDRVIDSMDMSVLYARYPEGSSNAYHLRGIAHELQELLGLNLE